MTDDVSTGDKIISIHALLAESDRVQETLAPNLNQYFYPRSPCGERRLNISKLAPAFYFYPRSPCGERRSTSYSKKNPLRISIHALLAESDQCRCKLGLFQYHFYPRSPCGERHETVNRNRELQGHFYPRSPCGERPDDQTTTNDGTTISIHALLAESDISFHRI